MPLTEPVPLQKIGERGTPEAPVDAQAAKSVADSWDGWERVYLDYLRRFGGRVKGAAVAGTSWRAVQEHEQADAAFAAAVATALEEYYDLLEQRLVEQAERRGNPVGYIVRLKAGRPAAYIERQAIQTVNVHVGDADVAEQARALLRHMALNITDATRRALTGEIGGSLPPEPQ